MNIKSCRVCGGSAGTDVDGLDWQVLCRGRCFEARYDSEQEAIEAWNKRASPWIPVSERWPEDEQIVFVLYHGTNGACKVYVGNDPQAKNKWAPLLAGDDGSDITHWQPVEIPE